MKADKLYSNAFGRFLVKIFSKCGIFKFTAWILHCPISKLMISRYIKKSSIDMTQYKGQTYKTFADFFRRKLPVYDFDKNDKVLISPCDGLLSIYPIKKDSFYPIKGSHYRLNDIVTESDKCELFNDGLCLIFRLEASDYHHFCAVDDMEIVSTQFVKGLLHSVQPIACEKEPVYRLNRRWWSLINTKNWGCIAQIEIGAMLVGGVKFVKNEGTFAKGDEIGNFELAGSTIVIFIDKENRDKLEIFSQFKEALNGEREMRVKMGEGIAKKK